MSYKVTAKYIKKSKTFVSKWVKCCSDVKTVDNQIEALCKNDEKGEQSDFTSV